MCVCIYLKDGIIRAYGIFDPVEKGRIGDSGKRGKIACEMSFCR